jgi:CHAT domain-containing protein/Tfp pilus assembly protein PilF
MRRCIGVLVLLACGAVWAAAPPVKGARGFTDQQKAWILKSNREMAEHDAAGRFAEAEKVAREQVELRAFVQGPHYWQTREVRRRVEEYARLAKLPAERQKAAHKGGQLRQKGFQLAARGQLPEAEKALREAVDVLRTGLGEDHPFTAALTADLGRCLLAENKPQQARKLFEQALAIRLEALGEGHPDTGSSHVELGKFFDRRGNTTQARLHYQKALTCYQKSLGEDHPDTGHVYNCVGACLKALGHPGPAQPMFEKALAISRKRFGDDHPNTTYPLDNLGTCWQELGEPARAQPLHEKALEVRLKWLGDDHPDVATSYNNLGVCLYAQGRLAQAQPLLEKALAIRARRLREENPDLAGTVNSLAACLYSQGRQAEALPLFEMALAIHKKQPGESHPLTAVSYVNLAACLTDLGKPDEALPLLQKALAIRRKAAGEESTAVADVHLARGHCLRALDRPAQAQAAYKKAMGMYVTNLGAKNPQIALCQNNLAWSLLAQDKPDEALPLARQALDQRRKAMGDDHPSTVASSDTVAACLWRLGRRAEAARLLQASLTGLETARFHGASSGFDRSQAEAVRFPHRFALAVGLARLGQPKNAFDQAEAGLARGLLDDLASADGDVQAARALQDRLEKLSQTLAAFAGRKDLTPDQVAQRDRAQRESRKTSAALARLLAEHSARQILPLERIQKAIPANAALVLWIDVEDLGEHWGCVVRRQGEPLWRRLEGSAKGGAWSAADSALAARLYAAIRDPASAAKDRGELVTAFVAQRFEPLRPHLKGVKRLFVVPAGPMAHVPAEVLGEPYGISYVPSGSVLAKLAEEHRELDGASLLALGDPAFDRPEPPDSGVLVVGVKPGSHAAKAGLKAGDVLLSIGATAIGSHDDLKAALANVPAEASAWRSGRRLKLRLEGNPLGAEFDARSARAALRAWRKANEPARGSYKPLPGTRVEAEAIAALVKGSTKLLGSDASEQKLDALQAKGTLKTFRILHFATHGEADERSPGRSALILARDDLPDPAEQARNNRHVYDGRLTVSKVRSKALAGGWELDADLVVLSACETGLGKDARGEGLIGFAQAFIHKGARSVVLSRWPVDDVATSLLMRRFYQNLLGKRDGLKKPMGRAESLREAKEWLRSLEAKDAEKEVESLPPGERGKMVQAPKGQSKTYEHPYYWAAFTLVGDPD